MIVSSDSADSRAVFEVVALLRREPGLQREIGHADDGVHRRADLVAHVGEELADRPACSARAPPRARSRLLGLAIGDVARDGIDQALVGNGADVHCSHL